jgi:hypothetical protein
LPFQDIASGYYSTDRHIPGNAIDTVDINAHLTTRFKQPIYAFFGHTVIGPSVGTDPAIFYHFFDVCGNRLGRDIHGTGDSLLLDIRLVGRYLYQDLELGRQPFFLKQSSHLNEYGMIYLYTLLTLIQEIIKA